MGVCVKQNHFSNIRWCTIPCSRLRRICERRLHCNVWQTKIKGKLCLSFKRGIIVKEISIKICWSIIYKKNFQLIFIYDSLIQTKFDWQLPDDGLKPLQTLEMIFFLNLHVYPTAFLKDIYWNIFTKFYFRRLLQFE